MQLLVPRLGRAVQAPGSGDLSAEPRDRWRSVSRVQPARLDLRPGCCSSMACKSTRRPPRALPTATRGTVRCCAATDAARHGACRRVPVGAGPARFHDLPDLREPLWRCCRPTRCSSAAATSASCCAARVARIARQARQHLDTPAPADDARALAARGPIADRGERPRKAPGRDRAQCAGRALRRFDGPICSRPSRPFVPSSWPTCRAELAALHTLRSDGAAPARARRRRAAGVRGRCEHGRPALVRRGARCHGARTWSTSVAIGAAAADWCCVATGARPSRSTAAVQARCCCRR